MLRSQTGSSLDRNQSHESCKDIILEEVKTLISAIEEDDLDILCEKLGDVLLQLIFHSEIASEEGYFNINDVVTGVCQKLLDKYPELIN